MIWTLLCVLSILLAADAAASASAEHAPPGRALAVVALLALSLALALAAAPVPSGLIAYAGLLPLLRGARQLLSVRFRPEPEEGEPPSGRPIWLAFRATLAAGGDLFVVALAVFATHTGAEVLGLAGSMLVAALVATLARRAVERGPDRLREIAGVVHHGKPWALVATGAALLVEGGALNWLLLRR
jgi:cadmium resistance protein CadD (predicted permease)